MKSLAWLLLNLVQAVLLMVWTVLCAAIVVPSRLFGRELPLRVPRLWSWLLLRLGLIRLEVEREADIDWSKAHIFVMNHQSMVDIPAVFLAVRTPLRFIAKRSLALVPFLGWYMRAVGMIFVDRARTAQAVASLQKAVEILRGGASIVAFPEGTRSPDGRIRPFKKGVFMVALQTGIPIVPMAIEGAREVLPPRGFRPRPGRIRLKIGQPITTEGRGIGERDALIAEVRGTMIRMHREIGGSGGDERHHVAQRKWQSQAAGAAAASQPAEEGAGAKRIAQEG